MDLQTIRVELQASPYPVIIGSAALLSLGDQIRGLGFKAGTKVLLVTNAVVEAHYGATALQSLSEAGLDASTLVIEAGEDQKTPATVGLIHNAAFARRLERGSLIVALGGGVVGDMAGFAAATWLRGIAVVQVPTTLLAMVDAAIGGKTGVNHPGGKNLIGAFHQPRLVLIDPSSLATLPEREFRAGMAEVIKYVVIGDSELLAELASTGHRRAEVVDLAVHRLLARDLDERAIAIARWQLEAAAQDGVLHAVWAERWRTLLERAPTELCASITADTVEAARLRQTSPFKGLVAHEDRRALMHRLVGAA